MAGKRWNGSAYVDHTTKKRWNGSSWVDLTIAKRWNGSAWVDIYSGGGGSSLVFTPSAADFEGDYFCSGGSCVISKIFLSTISYTVTGNTGAYSVTATPVGSSIIVDTSIDGFIDVEASCGRNTIKSGEVEVVVADTVGSITVNLPFMFTYNWSAV